MDSETSWQAITAQRTAIADVLDTLSDDQWDAPSLCDGWRVRDVAAHLVLGARRLGLAKALKYAARARGRFDAMNVAIASDHANRAGADIAADLRKYASSRQVVMPLVVDHKVVLTDVSVHGFDIARPVGAPYDVPVEVAVEAARHVWKTGWPFFAKRRLRGLHLKATDSGFEAGDGALVEGPTSSLLLVETGRRAGLADLGGPGVTELTERLRS